MRNLKTFFKLVALFVIGGAAYVLIELLWRGHSHISMFILGGMCFVSIGLINELFPWELGIVWQALIGGVLVTVLEFITGLIVNIWLGLNVWDYSKLPLNLMGQICLPFSAVWFILYFPAEYLCLALKRKFEPKERNQFEAM